ncbi:hypothetical protein TIFTF001_009905 [Ficus carica]|uniref:Uncharacterized protein n=1 Tax=Ficus carica TaxID=3494 RepID=A0AA87ZX82_FICCA|nr:hypothetical protein TIFTF001_009905 [Ficus carica]
MDFLAGVLDGKIALACHPATWKAYVSCLVGLMVNFAPAWIQEVKLKTLRTLANGLRGWHECELALALLERGGVAAIGSAAELVNEASKGAKNDGRGIEATPVVNMGYRGIFLSPTRLTMRKSPTPYPFDFYF